MKYYVIGEDKSLVGAYTAEEIDEMMGSGAFLPLSGGNMTGNIGYNSGVRTGNMIRFIRGDQNGSGVSIGDGGTTVIGGGEAATLYEPAQGSASTEKVIIASDTTIEFYTNAQNGVGSAAKAVLQTNGLLSGHQKAITSGTAAPSGGSNGDIYIQYQ